MFSIVIVMILLLPPMSESVVDFFTSLSDMEILIETEDISIARIEKYVKGDRRKLNIAARYLKQSEELLNDSKINVTRFLENPINSFRLIKTQADLKLLDQIIRSKSYYQKDKKGRYPTEKDFKGATKGLIRVQTTYELNITELSNGILRTNFSQNLKMFTETVTPMTASDCFVLGHYQESLNQNEKIEWLKQAFHKYKSSKCGPCFVELEEITNALSTEYCNKGDFNNTLEWTLNGNESKIKQPDEYAKLVNDVKKRVDQCTELLQAGGEVIGKKDSFTHVSRALCREHINAPRRNAKLKCSYKTGPRPILKLARLKAEQLHRNPDIWMFHNVINDAEVDTIINMAKINLQRVQELDYRIAKASYFLNEKTGVMARMLRRMSHYTDIPVDTTEPLHAMNYGVGGYVERHYDWFRQNYSNAFFGDYGNRMATVVLYLSDVTYGGSTVFSRLGLKVDPVKGTAIFWRNLLPAGDPDFDTYHLSCPLLRGNKWIGTKWIHESASNVCPVWLNENGEIFTEDTYQQFIEN